MVATPRSGGDRKTKHTDEYPRGIPSKPGDLAEDESRIWDMLLEQIPETVLRANDWLQFKELCVLAAKEKSLAALMRSDPADLKVHRAYMANAALIKGFSMLYGLSPMDRQRIRVEPSDEETDDEWSDD